jgi:hypothetical protein
LGPGAARPRTGYRRPPAMELLILTVVTALVLTARHVIVNRKGN